jgi:hypothetical protein
VISTLVVPIFMKIMANYTNLSDKVDYQSLIDWRDSKGNKLNDNQINRILHNLPYMKESYTVQQRLNFISLIPIIGNIRAAFLDYKRSSELENR